jgi:hypothetical protein
VAWLDHGFLEDVVRFFPATQASMEFKHLASQPTKSIACAFQFFLVSVAENPIVFRMAGYRVGTSGSLAKEAGFFWEMKMPTSFKIDISDERIRGVFDLFLKRMRPEVLESFEGFLTEVRLVDSISCNDNAAGVCTFTLSAEPSVTVEFSLSLCQRLTDPAVIGAFAHEFGHAEDRLFNGNCAELYQENAEAAANAIATYWGFQDEVRCLHKELGFTEVPLDSDPLTEEDTSTYWEMRPFQVKSVRGELF